MINLPKEYRDRIDPTLWQNYQNAKLKQDELKIKLNNAYQSINEINLSTKSNDAEYGRIKLSLIDFINEADLYDEAEVDTKLLYYSQEQARIKAENDAYLLEHKRLLEIVKSDEIKLENIREEIKIMINKIKK